MGLSDLEQLARWRNLGARHSEEVLELAPKVLASTRLGEQEWAIREQLAIAALDCGQRAAAEVQIQLLHRRFPNSPRVAILDGLALEAKGEPAEAKRLYQALLEKDETNVAVHQRLIALSLSTTDIPTTLPLLLTYLDSFYTDPSGWSLLADLYCELGLYGQALAALGHLMILQTWDSFAVCRAGEIAYTSQDFQLALKYFLRATEMESGPDGTSISSQHTTRSWWGVEKCSRRLLEADSGSLTTSVPAESSTTLEQLHALRELATERLLAARGAGVEVRRGVLGDAAAAR